MQICVFSERSVSSVSSATSFCAATHTSAAAVTVTISQDTFNANSQSLTAWVHTLLAATNVADDCHTATVGAQMTHVLHTSKFNISISLSASVFFLDTASLCMPSKLCSVTCIFVQLRRLRCLQNLHQQRAPSPPLSKAGVHPHVLLPMHLQQLLSAHKHNWCHRVHRLEERGVMRVAGQCCMH